MDLKTKVVQLLATGSTPKLAAGAVGLTEGELDTLRDGDEQFNKACVMARSNMLASAAEKLHKARDWRAAQKLLATAPETRDDYGEHKDGNKLEVVININRDATVSLEQPRGVTIEHEKQMDIDAPLIADERVEHRPEPEPAPLLAEVPITQGEAIARAESQREREAGERAALEKRLRAEYVAEHEGETRAFDGSIT